MSHRRFASESTAPSQRKFRPLSILSPPATPPTQYSAPNIQLDSVLHGLDSRKSKLYCEGYLQKLNDLNSDGTKASTSAHIWHDVYASLTGNVLSVWPAREYDITTRQARCNPQYINITDARILPPSTADPRDIIISTAGKNRYILRAIDLPDQDMSTRWLLALRLSIFERARAQEIYTSNLFLKYHNKDIAEVPTKEEKWAGHVDVRITGGDVFQSHWTKMWCTVHAPSKSGFLRKAQTKSSSNDNGQEVRFYTSKKDRAPFVVMRRVFAAYAVYPEHIDLVESAGMIKLEGQIPYRSTLKRYDADGFVLVIPSAPETCKRLSLGSTTPSNSPLVSRILKLLNAIWTTFELYNRPKDLLLNVDHVDALGTNGGLIDIPAETLPGLLPVTLSDEASWRTALRNQQVLQSHYAQVAPGLITPQPSPQQPAFFAPTYKRIGSDRRIVSEGSVVPRPKTLITSLEEDEEEEYQATQASPYTVFNDAASKKSPDRSSMYEGLTDQMAMPPRLRKTESREDHILRSLSTHVNLGHSSSDLDLAHVSPINPSVTRLQRRPSISASDRSVSVYSASIAESALDLVRPIHRQDTDNTTYSPAGSIYSQEEKQDQSAVQRLVKNRAIAVEALDINRPA